MKKMTLHFMRILASAFIGLTMTAGCLSVEPYHIRARKVAKLEMGMELDVARRKLGEGLRHLFTVRRSGSEWTLCSVLIDTGVESHWIEVWRFVPGQEDAEAC